MKRLIVRPAAEQDLATAYKWHREIREDLALRFLADIQDGLKRITRGPRLYAVVGLGMRRLKIKTFKYAIYFKEMQESIEVFAILHTSRDPDLWRLRT